MATRPIRMLSLFSGAGGLDLGIRIALPGVRTLCYVERELAACQILAARMADGSAEPAPIFTDIAAFDGHPWRGAVDLIVGGFPCTDLSVAGKRAGITGEHSGLWFEYLRIIREVQPRWVFIENVPAVIADPAGGIVLGGLAEVGFDAEWISLRASDVGAPHKRERVFILAVSKERGFRELRQSSGSERFVDGNGWPVEHAVNGGHQDGWTSGSGEVRNGRHEDVRHETSESNRGMGDTAGERSREARELRPHGPDDGDSGAGGDVDDSAIPRHSTGRSEPSRAVRDGARRPESDGRRDAVADAGCSGERRSKESPELNRQRTSGDDCRASGELLVHPEHPERRTPCICGRCGIEGADGGRQAASGAGESVAALADAGGEGLQERSGERSDGNALQPRGGAEFAGDDRARIFPPGPADRDGWAELLRTHPHFAPAIEPGLRVSVDGLALVVDEARTDQLRAAGNGVVALCAALAFTVLAHRAGLDLSEFGGLLK